MAMRKIKDAKDLSTNELIYFKGHAKATYMSDGRSVEDAINNIPIGGGAGGGSSSGAEKEVVHVSNEVIETLQPNKVYIYESHSSEFEIRAIEEPVSDYAEYNVIINATPFLGGVDYSPTIILPDYVNWANGVIPDLSTEAYYELSIVYWCCMTDAGYNAVLTPFKSVE